MGEVVEMSLPLRGKLKHRLFSCPSFWKFKKQFHCPICGKGYRCYWDGNDFNGLINVCNKCAKRELSQRLSKTVSDTEPSKNAYQQHNRLE